MKHLKQDAINATKKLETNNINRGIQLITGSANPELAKSIGKILQQNLENPITQFADGESRCVIKSSLRKKGVFIIQSTSPPDVNRSIIELVLMLDAARRESPDEITAVIPYFGYARQDRREQPGTTISAAVIAKTIVRAGSNRIVTIDLHSEQSISAVDYPWDNLYASKVLVPALKEYGIDPKKTVVATPDKGGLLRTIKYAEMLGVDQIAIAYKQRDIKLNDISKVLFLVGDVNQKTVIIPDDILASGGTLIEAARIMKEKGAKRILAAISHGQFLDDSQTGKSALEKIEESPIDKLFVTDTIAQKEEVRNHQKIKIISVDLLLADFIYFIYTGEHLNNNFI